MTYLCIKICVICYKKIDFDKGLLDQISSLDTEETKKQTTLEVREQYQYGTTLTLKENLYDEQLELAKKIIAKTKLIIEE